VIMSVLFIRWMQQQERQQREEESRWEAMHRDTPPAWQKWWGGAPFWTRL